MTSDSVNIRDVTSIRFDGKNSYDIELRAYYYEEVVSQAEIPAEGLGNMGGGE